MVDAAPDERLLTTFEPDRSVLLEWTGIGMGAVLVSLFALGWLYVLATGDADTAVGGEALGPGSVAVGVVGTALLVAAVVVLHELVHGAVIRYYGGDVSYGVGLAGFVMPYAYATTTQRLTRDQFVVVALAPLVLITVVGFGVMVALESLWLLLPLAFNVGGAIGDCWMATILLRYPRHVVVEDSVSGLKIYGREGDRPLPPTGARRFVRRVALGTAVGFGLLLVVAMAALVPLLALGAESFVVGQPGTPWSVFAFESTPDGGFSYSVNPLGLLAVSVLVGFVLALLAMPRRPDAGEGA